MTHAAHDVTPIGGTKHIVGKHGIGRLRITGEAHRGHHLRNRALQVTMLLRCAIGIKRTGCGHIRIVLRRLLSQPKAIRCHQEGGACGGRAKVRLHFAGSSKKLF